MADLAPPPVVRGTIQQNYVIEPLRGGQDIRRSLRRFPEEIYSQSPDSHLAKFLSTLLGANGVNWLRKNNLRARIMLEELGIELFDLDRFFGNPIGFGRMVEETYQKDPQGLLSKEEWGRIKAKDAKYRNRALDYFNGARLGNTKEGMRLTSKAGLGHEVEIIENYRWLFDQHSDDPLGLEYFGKTLSTEEMIVLPRRDLPKSEIQRVTIDSLPVAPDSGTFQFYLPIGKAPHTSLSLTPTATRDEVRIALESIALIGVGGVQVSGPFFSASGLSWYWDIAFVGGLAGTDVPELQIFNGLYNSSTPDTSIEFSVETIENGRSAIDEIVSIAPRDLYHWQYAVDRIRALTTIPTIGDAPGLHTRNFPNAIVSSSAYSEVIRYAAGNNEILWPPLSAADPSHWIEKEKEHEAPRVRSGAEFHYQGWHNVLRVYSYTDEALDDAGYEDSIVNVNSYASNHLGQHNPAQQTAYPFLQNAFNAVPDMALPDYVEPLEDKSEVEDDNLYFRRVYPADYVDLPGVPQPLYKSDQFWSSRERAEGIEYLEIDLGSVQGVNYLTFEVSNKPVTISLAYDILDQHPRRRYKDVTPLHPFDRDVYTGANPSSTNNFIPLTVGSTNPWRTVQFNFGNALGELVFTRFVRIAFERTANPLDPFLYDPLNRIQNPWSVEVRNLRVARNVH